MQQRLAFRRAGKVACVIPEEKIRRQQALRDRGLPQLLVVRRNHEKAARDQREQHHDKQCRKNAPHATVPEFDQRKASVLKISREQSRDEKAGDHEEHIHADIAAGEARAGMIKEHRQHGDRSQPVDVAAVAAWAVCL